MTSRLYFFGMECELPPKDLLVPKVIKGKAIIGNIFNRLSFLFQSMRRGNEGL